MAMNDVKPKVGKFARAGKIRLGIKVKNKDGVEYPKETEYFVLKDTPELVPFFKERYNTDQPKEIPIFFPFNDVDRNIDGWYKLHLGSSVYCKGDGSTVVYAVDNQTGKRVIDNGYVIRETKFDNTSFKPGDTVRCPGMNKVDAWGRCEFCNPNSNINFMIRGLPVKDLTMATYQIESPSKNLYPQLIEQVLAALDIIEDLTGERNVAGVPFIMKRVKKSMGAPNLNKDGSRKMKDGKKLPPRMRTEHYMIDLTIEPTWIEKMWRRKMERQAHLLDSGGGFSLPETAYDYAEESKQEPVAMEGDFVNIDFDNFAGSVIKAIPYYTKHEQINAAMVQLDLMYDPENEEFLLDQLARHAQYSADKEASIEQPQQSELDEFFPRGSGAGAAYTEE